MPAALWRRIDTPGHDAAHVDRTNTGWRLEGRAVFAHDLGPAHLTYWVECAADWITRDAGVTGWVGDRRCDVRVTRSESGQWGLNGQPVEGVEACFDVDFGFTPATNFLQLRRCGLGIGARAVFPVAWLDVPDPSLTSLPQHYERRTSDSYWYESPQGPYSAEVQLADSGFVRRYPGLWVMDE